MGECELAVSRRESSFFKTDTNKHYLCEQSIKHDCFAGNQSIGSVTVHKVEFELNRSKPVNRGKLQFETPAQQCISV